MFKTLWRLWHPWWCLNIWCTTFERPVGCFINVSRALQNILSKFVYCRNRTSCENFKLKLCTCAQSYALGTHTKFKREILTINVFSGIVFIRLIILENSRNPGNTIHPSLNLQLQRGPGQLTGHTTETCISCLTGVLVLPCLKVLLGCLATSVRDQSRYAPSQWETSLL